MAHAGQVIENPVTGEHLAFLVTAGDSDGKLLRFEVTARPQAVGPPEHVHPRAHERYELKEGRLHVRLEGKERIVEAPANVHIPAGAPHTFWNGGDEPARMVIDFQPAGTFEDFLVTLYDLAADGKTNARGVPNPLQMAVIAERHLDDIHLARPPVAIQRFAFALLAPIGRLAGFQEKYAR